MPHSSGEAFGFSVRNTTSSTSYDCSTAVDCCAEAVSVATLRKAIEMNFFIGAV
jgi:hypothetical protein